MSFLRVLLTAVKKSAPMVIYNVFVEILSYLFPNNKENSKKKSQRKSKKKH